ncbi:nitrilase [Actinoplanes sp. KI2]|uniref:nitrilase-related carbon-nitrogen hydrolase n=1 Tax=Actinoplanes sp. KI2 TaxID=2983315 RepID=UPI0021D596F1|nr:nitrilase-related carbon-nitrogen hydrolase [Actinoplanes sp. KI2]MCU7722547.1 nitrilase [Actinoplanes sp. KI2]
MLIVVAAALSGLLWLGGTGLHPVAALTWLAPLPLLLVSVRVRPAIALAATAAAWVTGQLGVLPYYHDTLRIPLPAVAGVVVLGAALATGTVLAARHLLLAGRTVTAVLTVPFLWVLGEYAASLLLPHGAWWSLAYTQAAVRPIIQVTALTGVWGVTYLLLAVPIAVAARSRPAAVCLLVLLAAGAGWSLTRPAAGRETVAVGLVALEQSDDGLPLDRLDGQDLLARYRPRVDSLIARGARIVVLPEKVFGVDSENDLVDAFRPETGRGVQLVVGAVLRQGAVARNVALVLGPGGTVTAYTKRHLIPGLEDWLTPGHADLIVGDRFGVAICKDLDFPGLVRGYRRQGATVLLVPALDFTEDGRLHSRMALVRGVESGLVVVRSAAAGRLTVTDATGRVRAEARAGNADLLVAAPRTEKSTIYARTGDWFPFLAIAALIGVCRAVSGGSPRRPRPPGR